MLRVGCVLAVLCVAGHVTATSAFAAFPGGNGKIAFASDRRGADFDIWAMNPDGTELVSLTKNSQADEFAPNWSADGRRIAFDSNRVTSRNPEGDHEIFLMNADGSCPVQITFNALDDEDPHRPSRCGPPRVLSAGRACDPSDRPYPAPSRGCNRLPPLRQPSYAVCGAVRGSPS